MDKTAALTEELQKELEIYRVLKPYIGHCLTLNHDLNNPLAGIIGYVEFILTDETISEDHRKFLNQVMTCAERMHQMINDLCEEKIALGEQIDLSSVIEMYQKESEQTV